MRLGSKLPEEEFVTPSPRSPPASERVLDGVVWLFALWTLCSWATVAGGGTLGDLMAFFSASAAILTSVLFLRSARRRRRSSAVRTPDPSPGLFSPPPWPVDRPPWWILRGLGLAGGIVLMTRFAASGDVVGWWWWGIGLLAVPALALTVDQKPVLTAPAAGRFREGALWGLAVLCAILALVAHRPDADDSFYIGVAVKAVEDPDWALYSSDPLHGVDSLPLHLPVYRLHSYELLNAALARLTGIPAVYCFHWISAAFGALLVPLAYARLLRLLAPRVWLGTLLALLVVLIGAGETHRWYSNFALVRIWQGKALYLSIFLPLIYVYAMEVGRRPSRRGWARLAAAQIAAVGCTSSAVWGGPVSAMLGLACVLRPSRRGLWRMAGGAMASTFVVLGGLLLKDQLQGLSRNIEHTAAAEVGQELSKALRLGLGDGRLFLFSLGVILVAWTLCPRLGLARRFAVVIPLAVIAVVFNPYHSPWLMSHLTGRSYWRGLWILPIPILIAFVLSSPLRLRLAAPLRNAVFALVLTLFVFLVPVHGVLSVDNQVDVDWPRAKVPELEHGWAAALSRAAGPGAPVLAPDEISLWLPTQHRAAQPLVVRRYPLFSSTEMKRRLAMIRVVGRRGIPAGALEDFPGALDDFEIAGVCLDRASRRATWVRDVLEEAGFRLRSRDSRYEVWTRNGNSG